MIEQKVENAKQQDFGLEGCYKQIEKAGRICYRSEGSITDSSYKAFSAMLKKNKHYSPFGHGTVVIDTSKMDDDMFHDFHLKTSYTYFRYKLNEYPHRWYQYCEFLIVSARVVMELSIDDCDYFKLFEPYLTDDSNIPSEYQRHTVKCTTSIAMTRELNRHAWSLDICERSTRYVKAGDWIKPVGRFAMDDVQQHLYYQAASEAFDYYNLLLEERTPKQYARDLLPLFTATEVYYTAFGYQWDDVITKRTVTGVHPQMIDLMNKIKEQLRLK